MSDVNIEKMDDKYEELIERIEKMSAELEEMKSASVKAAEQKEPVLNMAKSLMERFKDLEAMIRAKVEASFEEDECECDDDTCTCDDDEDDAPCCCGEKAAGFVRAHPLAAAGIALTAGFILGSLLRRD